MPEPRDARVRTAALVTLESPLRDQALATRRQRAGKRGPIPVAVRNGLPEPRYVYRGTGHDTMECTCHA